MVLCDLLIYTGNRKRLEWEEQQEEEDSTIVKWTQEDLETLYNLLINK